MADALAKPEIVDDAEGASCEVLDKRNDFQGPHNWRHNLRHVEELTINGSSHSFDENKDSRADKPVLKSPDTKDVKKIPRPHDIKLRDKSKPLQTPTWKQALIEKKGIRPVVAKHSQESAASPTTAQAPKRRSLTSGAESAFTQQVVIPVQGIQRKRVSPSNSFRQSNQGGSATNTAELTKKRIERVQRARLYLLQQTGPNSFLIGGDSPDHKFRVIIGPQTCNCGRGPHCVHVLFVMLRVFKLSETDSCLISKTLKNYEVENLFRVYHDKQSSRINKRKNIRRKRSKVTSDDVMTNSTESINLHNESDAGSVREEEETCPICLLEMFEGESLLKCENGCQNRLHHHCIAIWFEDRRRQSEPLICPLCRAHWTTSTVEMKSTLNTGQEAPPNTRASSPQHPGIEGDMRLPYAEPIPSEYTDIATPWIQVLGEDLVNCLFSRNWSIRETGLKHLSKEVVGTLMRGVGEGRSGVVVSSSQLEANHTMLETCCNILAFMCADPVYRVFVASLRAMRTMLSYTPCRDEEQMLRLQKLLRPIVDAIIIKCTDGNRRTSQLSISTLVELAKGQTGELAVGREIVDPGTFGVDGLSFVLRCTTEDYTDNVQWQWLLGRLYVIDRLIETFPDQFSLPCPYPCITNDGSAAAGPEESESPQVDLPTNSHKILDVAQFSIKAVCNAHTNISSLAKRIFIVAAKLSLHVESVIKEIEKLFALVDSSAVTGLKRKLAKIVENYNISEKIVQELHHGSKCNGHFDIGSPTQTSMDSPVSTPRCNSPVTDTSEQNASTRIPQVPPNTPTHRSQRRGCRKIPKEVIDKAVSPELNGKHNGEFDDIIQAHIPLAQLRKLRRDKSLETPHRHGLSCVPENEPMTNSEEIRQSISQDFSSKNSGSINLSGSVCRMIPKDSINIPKPEMGSLSEDEVQSIPELHSESIPVIVIHDESVSGVDVESICGVHIDLESIPEYTGDIEDSIMCEEDTNIVDSVQSSGVQSEDVSICDKKDLNICLPNITLKDSQVCCCNCHKQPVDGASSYSGAVAAPNTPDEGSVCVYHTEQADEENSDEMMVYQPAGCSNGDRPVSFITEVTQSPSTSPNHAREHSQVSDCPCKDEVEKEEAAVLAKALAVSERTDACPVVPGLTPTSREEVITIRIQPENYNDVNDNGPSIYLEQIHWVKGPLLGTGAFSTCYQARDVRTGVIMAVKQISFCRNSSSEQDKVVEAISEEIHMMSRLNHANVVRIFGATKQGCHFNMFVEWMPGGSVAYLLGTYGSFSEGVILNYIKQCLLGLSYLHDKQILHRDLKGANLLVDSTGQKLRIGDFGAAARLASQTTGAGEFQGQLLGTIAFMAPEVLRGYSYGRACDIWSVGCVIIEMATARPPWNAQDVSNHLALIFKIASSVQPPPIPDNLSQPLRDLLLRCLEQNSDNRPTSKDLLIHPVFEQLIS
ncbi:hypothetical protein LOTGIDRAFT_162448 [Lottia gigantea]|uniref:Mitogen-activated protein kinase kinase kinase 1 n=1 Tax=Lottia gigantea TaxID=225164 RepID=V4A738_LOTGI|nr:hypothetical protein LOTGIDRAFT_162448 [Lottia gigantea]ESO92542.1 hypothetical protein LOTGIDRAFT_162448 [Lottia gigantea]